MTKSAIIKPDPKLDLVLERVIDVPRELVWRAWTTPELLRSAASASSGFSTVTIESISAADMDANFTRVDCRPVRTVESLITATPVSTSCQFPDNIRIIRRASSASVGFPII